ncbi:MAG: LamG-like jellyroll fold domain-containing protein, partial [Candidatus Micrarchaeaceae archaeon]
TYVYDSSSPSSSPLFAVYANNGTTVGSSTQHQNVIQYIAISNGQIVASASGGAVSMFTQILNSSYSAGQIWTISPSCSPYPIGLATYAGVIAYGCGDNANLITVSNSLIVSTPLLSAISGVSIHSGNIAFQNASGVSLFNTAGSLQWSEAVPSAYGTAIANATPAISSQNVYTLWSNKYLLMQNLSTGAITANTSIPYPGSINPYMALAYGRLFASVGSHLMAFGSCPVNTNDSILSAIGTLYINGRGSCASYILSKLQQSSNYAITIDNVPKQSAAYFSGSASSYIKANAASLPIGSAARTLTAWISMASDGQNIGAVGYGGTSASLQIFDIGVYPSDTVFFWGSGDDCQSNLVVQTNTWTFIAVTYLAGANTVTLYDNGSSQTCNLSGGVPLNTPAGTQFSIGVGLSTNSYPFPGKIANIQVYNKSLSSQQVYQLYQEGIGGAPLPASGLVGWWPLNGNANGYANQYTAGYPLNAPFQPVSYNSVSFQNSYSVTSQSVPIPLLNYSKGAYKLYNVGIYSWK